MQIHPKTAELIAAVIYPLPQDIQIALSCCSTIANILTNDIQPKMDADGIEWDALNEYHYGFGELIADCAKAKAAGVLENRHIKKIIADCWNFPYIGYDLIQYCKETKILEEANSDELVVLVKQAIIDLPKAVAELKQGKEKAIGAIVGAVMKKQKANPADIQKIIKSELGL